MTYVMTYVLPLLLYACASFNRVGGGGISKGKTFGVRYVRNFIQILSGMFQYVHVFYILKITLVSTGEFACIHYKYTFLFA